MILRYYNLETAALAVAKLRSEGYFAQTCDDAVATLWGPGAVGGVRVVASDTPVEGNPDERLPESPIAEAIMSLARILVAVILIVSFLGVASVFLLVAITNILGFVIALLIYSLVAVFLLFGAALIAIVIHPILSQSLLRTGVKGSHFDSLIVVITMPLILMMSLM